MMSPTVETTNERSPKAKFGFTLIELSIVLVIIGLIVGSVAAGQHMIKAAELQATVTQIDKYNAAANTFRAMCEGLPGDVSAQGANACGLKPRGQYEGMGDGNGIIEGTTNNLAGQNAGMYESSGETVLFWEDLAQMGLIDGSFNTGSASTPVGSDVTLATSPNVSAYFPQAKIGQGNYFYVYSASTTATSGSINYFGLSAVSSLITYGCGGCIVSNPGLTVAQAYAIDKKIDDGLPQYGKVTATYLNAGTSQAAIWALGDGTQGPNNGGGPTTGNVPGSSITCYDNASVNGTVQQYSMSQNNGSGVNCALSFQFQ